ncbi:hypothetical protein HPB51_010996 [Rhipicephalus microplus]|uniref:Uncharacterized protein n=1 Tax=Rhipicephalus microplus TaxID=6941 RepID=A0A9J6ETF2_RHIMP|nr:hypothetical protein HPB51_010996 [Rhipicephalus microplus]
MKRTEKNRLLRKIKLRPPQHWWKAKHVRTSVATQENAPVYMNHLRTNTSRTPMRRREMTVAAVQLQVIFVLHYAGQSDVFTTGQCPRKITNAEMTLPRITGRQMQRSNVPSATPEEYYRRNVYFPLLADFENQLRDRFDVHKKVVVGLNMLLPKFCASASLSDIDDAVQFYLGDIPLANVTEAEFTQWVNKCYQIEEKNRPACALQALEMCNRDLFPNIHSLLSILATLPVSTPTPE